MTRILNAQDINNNISKKVRTVPTPCSSTWNIAYVSEDNPLSERKIESASTGLKPDCKKQLQRISKNSSKKEVSVRHAIDLLLRIMKRNAQSQFFK